MKDIDMTKNTRTPPEPVAKDKPLGLFSKSVTTSQPETPKHTPKRRKLTNGTRPPGAVPLFPLAQR